MPQVAGVELAKPLKPSLLHYVPQMPDCELQDLMFFLPDFDLALVWLFFVVP